MKNTASFFCLTVVLGLVGCTDSATASASSNAKPQKESGHEHAAGEKGHDDAGHKEKEKGGHDDHGDEEGEEGVVKLSPEQIKNAEIELATVAKAAIRTTLPLYGVIAPNAERVRDVSARYPGTLRQVDIKIGDTVRQGDTLATVESNESLQVYAVKAPLNGVVTARQANPGEQTGEKVLFTVADLSSVWVELALFPRDASQVRAGQPVRVKTTDGGVIGEGSIAYVSPIGISSNQTLTARVTLDNSEHRWAPGLYVTADVGLSETQVPLAIRNDAVQTVEGRSVVFVKGAEGFEAHPVRLGRSDGVYSEVLEGLKAGETYVSTNSFVLKAELTKGEAGHDH